MIVGDTVYYIHERKGYDHKPIHETVIQSLFDNEGVEFAKILPTSNKYIEGINTGLLYEDREDAVFVYTITKKEEYNAELDEKCSEKKKREHAVIGAGYKNEEQIILKDQNYRDARGEMIYFPKYDRPYYDRALGKTFNSKKEKSQYLKKNKLAMDGSNDKHNNNPEAGDYRKRKPLYI